MGLLPRARRLHRRHRRGLVAIVPYECQPGGVKMNVSGGSRRAAMASYIRPFNRTKWFGQFLFQCGPSCALMGADMLVRFKHYTGGSMPHTHASVAS